MTRITLELPASAAAKLAKLTPAQLAELSAILGYEVKSVTIQPSEVTRRARANAALYVLTTWPAYHDAVPWTQMNEILTKHGFRLEEGDIPLALDADSSVHVQVGDKTWLLVSWYRMPSGRYEVIAYVS